MKFFRRPGSTSFDFARFRPRLLDTLPGYGRQRLLADISAGLTVGVVALPLAMAFAIASGVKPEQGLFTAIIAGFIISALGGSNVQIGGPAGAFIVIVYGIVERYGLTNLLISTALAGVLLFTLGLLRLGTLVRYVPVNIVIGFTNGIAVLIALSQVKDLLGLQIDKLPADFIAQVGSLGSHLGTTNPYAVAIGLACLALVALWPKAQQAPLSAGHAHAAPTTPGASATAPQPEKNVDTATPSRGQRLMRGATAVPGTVVALVLATLATALLELPVDTIGSRFGGIPQSLPRLELPPFSWESAKQLLIPTLTIALLGAIESLLCARVADNMSGLPRHDPNQELMAQGIANLVVPFFGGIPATGTIARTSTNVRSGGTTPVSGMVHALTMLVVVLVAAPLAASVPLAALAGILLFVAWNMGEWREFQRLRHFTQGYRIVLLGTFFLTVVFDLTIAMQVGLVLACVFFIYRMSKLFEVRHSAVPGAEGVVLFRLYGALFFGAVAKVEAVAAQLEPGTRAVVLEMQRLISLDASGLDALDQLRRALARKGVRLMLCDINPEPMEQITRTGFDLVLGRANLAPDLPTALSRLEPVVQEPA